MFKCKIKLLIIILFISFFQTSNNMFNFLKNIKISCLKKLKIEKKNNKNNNLIKNIPIKKNNFFIENNNSINNENNNIVNDIININNNEYNFLLSYKTYLINNFNDKNIEIIKEDVNFLSEYLKRNNHDEYVTSIRVSIGDSISFLQQYKSFFNNIEDKTKDINLIINNSEILHENICGHFQNLKLDLIDIKNKIEPLLKININNKINIYIINKKINRINSFINDIENLDKNFNEITIENNEKKSNISDFIL